VVLDLLVRLLTRLLGQPGGRPHVTAEELKAYVRVSGAAGRLEAEERDMLEDVIELGEVRLTQAMVPRVDVAAVDLAEGREGILRVAREDRVSKVLVYEGSRDEVRGYVPVKDLLYRPEKEVRSLVRPIRAVPETKTVESMLREFRESGSALALVVDEYGGTEGIVTPEDLIEEIVGEISDEYDPREGVVQRIAPGVSVLPGELPIREWEERSGIPLPRGKYDTVGGFVLESLGRMPRPGDRVDGPGVRFTVLRVRRGRVLGLLAAAAGKKGAE
jgi:putative hemolysin